MSGELKISENVELLGSSTPFYPSLYHAHHRPAERHVGRIKHQQVDLCVCISLTCAQVSVPSHSDHAVLSCCSVSQLIISRLLEQVRLFCTIGHRHFIPCLLNCGLGIF
jgi:hypothetical protein